MLQHDRDIYTSAALRQLLDDQTHVMTPNLQRCFGVHALLVGASSTDVPPVLPMLGCWTRLWMDEDSCRGDLIAPTDALLPFVDDAFDLVLLRHALEVVAASSVLLAESIRVLSPGGMLVVTGVHPVSAWAPWFYWRARGGGQALHMPFRLVLALQQAGMDIERLQRVGSLLPGVTKAQPTLARAFGGGYVLIARKRRHGVTPLRRQPMSGTRRNASWRISTD
jgi:SAM-dependent methyltransferase